MARKRRANNIYLVVECLPKRYRPIFRRAYVASSKISRAKAEIENIKHKMAGDADKLIAWLEKKGFAGIADSTGDTMAYISVSVAAPSFLTVMEQAKIPEKTRASLMAVYDKLLVQRKAVAREYLVIR